MSTGQTGPRLLIVGPPVAGKGTQAARIADRYGIPTISTGDIFRSNIANGTELGKQADDFMQRGALVPDDLVIAMVMERITEPDCAAGFMLDGFPRTRPQAEALDKALEDGGVALDAVVLITVPDDLIVDRITGRRSDPETGTIYHLTFNPPPADVAGRVVQRKDDTEEACRARLTKYHSETAPVIPFYEQKQLVHRVDGVGKPAEVTARIIAALA